MKLTNTWSEPSSQVESDYDPFAVSPKGCKGLMQLHPDTAHRFGVDDIFHPEDNLNGGIKYLLSLIGRFNGDLPLILAAYNAGENAVIRHQGIPPYEETVNYVKRWNRFTILTFRKILRESRVPDRDSTASSSLTAASY